MFHFSNAINQRHLLCDSNENDLKIIFEKIQKYSNISQNSINFRELISIEFRRQNNFKKLSARK